MDVQTLTWIGMGLALYALPFTIGLSQARLRAAVMLATASYCGLYVSAWSALGALFLPLADLLITRFELATVLVLSFLAGALQAVLLAALGFGVRTLWLAKNDPADASDASAKFVSFGPAGKA